MTKQSLMMVLMTPLLAAAMGTLGCDRLEDVLRDGIGSSNGGSGGRGGSTTPGDPPPSSGDRCRESRDANNNPCRQCVDASGVVVIDTCSVPPAPGPIDHCDVRSDSTTGAACRVCYDATGAVVVDGCKPQPGPTCETVAYEGGPTCTVCYDASGTAVSRTCPRS